MPPAVEGDALADQDRRAARGLRLRDILADQEDRRARAARIDAEQAAHLLPLDGGLVEHPEAQPVPLRERARLPRELARPQVVARRVPEVARPRRRLRHGARTIRCSREGRRVDAGGRHDVDDGLRGLAFRPSRLRTALVSVEAVVRGRDLRQETAQGLGCDSLVEDDRGTAPLAGGILEGLAQRHAQAARRRGGPSQADERPGPRGGDLFVLAAEAGRPHRLAQRAAHRGANPRRRIPALVQERDPRERAGGRSVCQTDSHRATSYLARNDSRRPIVLTSPPHDDRHRDPSFGGDPLAPRQGSRALRPRRLTSSCRERSDLGVRRGALPGNPGQGQDPQPALQLLVPEVRGRREPHPRDGRGEVSGGAPGGHAPARRALRAGPQVRGHPLRVRGPRATSSGRAGPTTRRPGASAGFRCPRACARRTG